MEHAQNASTITEAVASSALTWGIYFTPEGNAVVSATEIPGRLVFAAQRPFAFAPRFPFLTRCPAKWSLVKSRGHEGLEDEALAVLNARAPDGRVPIVILPRNWTPHQELAAVSSAA